MEWKDLFPVLGRKFSIGRCMDHVRAIYDTDHWFSFDKYPLTAEYCENAMKKAGLTDTEQIPVLADGKTVYHDWKLPLGWKAESATLCYCDGEIIADYSRMPCSLVMCSPSTPQETVEAEVVDLNTGETSLAGKLLLTDKSATAVLPLAQKAGALGILSAYVPIYPGVRDSREEFYDHCPWMKLGGRSPENRIFAFHLTPRQADALRERMRGGTVRLRASVRASFFEGNAPTVTGLLPGRDPSLPEVFAYGHLYEPGANDNASGSAALLELAQALSEAVEEGLLPRPRRSIRFAMGYECGGSMGYLAARPGRRMLCAGVFDMVGTETRDRAVLSLRYDPLANWSFADAALRASNRLCAAWMGKSHTARDYPFRMGLGTDNILADPCFDSPAVAMVAAPALSYHSSMDSPDCIEPEVLRRNALIMGVYLYGLADADGQTADFLEAEIRSQAAAMEEAAEHPRGKRQAQEAQARALHSLGRIAPCTFPEPQEQQLPIPDYALQTAHRVPVRQVMGTLTLAAHPEVKDPPFRPGWSAEWNIPLFWADGKRDLWQIGVQTALELGECSDDAIRSRYEKLVKYFDFLAELGYIRWNCEA